MRSRSATAICWTNSNASSARSAARSIASAGSPIAGRNDMIEPLDRFVLHGATLALAWFAIVSALASALVALSTTRLTARLEQAPSAVWFALRVLPAAAAALFVTAIFLPSYWLSEPRDAGEAFKVT